MGKKRIRSTLYMESKISRKGFYAEFDQDGYLFADGKYRTKIKPADLPEWYIYGYLYKRHGFISAKGVRYMLYVPNYIFDNHLHKYDTLFISYNEEIEPYTERGFSWYIGYDHAIGSSLIVSFVDAAGKYSDYDVSEIQEEIKCKQEWYYARNPEANGGLG